MWVLTAAHCVNKTLPVYLLNNWRVRVGTTDLASQAGTSYKVVRVIVNAKYMRVGNEKGSDIALVKIKADTDTDPGKATGLKAIRILGDKPGDMPLAETDSLEVSGWGSTQPRDGQETTTAKLIHGSAQLMKATVTKVPIFVCELDQDYLDLILEASEKGKAGDPVICVKNSVGQADACQGDSGGPLTIGTETVLVGLVSLGKGCGNGTAAIYTNVTYFLDWIAAAKLEPAGKASRW
jgi:secreted trypsin-like serine protease